MLPMARVLSEEISQILELDEETAVAVARLIGTPRFSTHAISGVQSLNNDVRLMLVDGERFALRLGNARTVSHLGVDRAEEAEIARLAGEAGLAPRVVAVDTLHGILVSEWVDVAAPLAAGCFSDAALMKAAIELASRLNGIGPSTRVQRTIFARIDAFEASLDRLGAAAMPDRHRRRLESYSSSGADDAGIEHNDLWPNNLLNGASRLWLTDFEFSGRGDGFYDLASIAIAADLSAAGERDLLAMAERRPGDHDRLRAMRWIVRYFEACWGLVMARLGAEAPDAAGQTFSFRDHATRMIDLLDD